MHSPHHVRPRMGRALPGRLRSRVGRLARASLRPPSRARASCRPAPMLTPRPEWVRGWDDLSADERRMHARQQEVFAGFLTHTDAQIGRVARRTRGVRADGQHPGHGLLGQRGQRRGRQGRQRQRAPLHRASAANRWRTTWPPTTTGAASPPTTTTRGPGPGPATRRTSCGSATPGWAAPAPR